jgi:hypothetical protein
MMAGLAEMPQALVAAAQIAETRMTRVHPCLVLQVMGSPLELLQPQLALTMAHLPRTRWPLTLLPESWPYRTRT